MNAIYQFLTSDGLQPALLPFGYEVLNKDGGYEHQQDQCADDRGLEEHAEGAPESGFDLHGLFFMVLGVSSGLC